MRISPATTRVLLALMVEDRPASVRRIAARAGITVAPCHRHLTRLQELGLVDWEAGKQRTVHPLVRVVEIL